MSDLFGPGPDQVPGVYVDPQFRCLMSKAWRWPTSCHLFADRVEDLHAFAARIGLKRAWFQLGNRGTFPHYDLNESRRAKAVAAGVIELDRRAARDKWRALGFIPDRSLPARLPVEGGGRHG